MKMSKRLAVTVLAASILLAGCTRAGFQSSGVSAEPVSESDAEKLDKRLEVLSAQHGLTDEDRKRLKSDVLAIARTRDRLSLRDVGESCGVELQRFCRNGVGDSAKLVCIKANRDRVSDVCEAELRKQFGSKPTEVAQHYLGVPIPKGSVYRYNHLDQVSSVILSDDVVFKGIRFKKGAIGFHKSGISVARLTSNQTIGGIEYLASGLGPFFNESGAVVNATLARDTEIDGIVYMAGQQITFHSKGRVNSGRVARAVRVQGASYSPGDMIYFDRKGAVRDLNKLNLFNAEPEPEPVTVAKDYIGRTFATTRPLAYQVGLPRRNQVSRYIADNSFTLYTEKADRRITDLRNNCVGCLGPDRIVTPIRVQYVPPGTSITVIDEYVHKSRSFSGSDIRMLIVKDERGNIAEIAAYQFDSDIAKPYTGRLDRTTATVISHVDSFKRNKELRLSFCPASFARKSASPEAFLRDFQMQDEVDITVGSTLCDDGYLLAFKTLESYLTSRYYFSEWGLHGKWSDRKTKPVLARPKRRPPQLTLNACSMKLSDVRKSGSCPGPKCELSKLCN